MKQILQSLKTGVTSLEIVPAPVVGRGTVLIQTTRSLVSLGTERMLVEFGRSNLISKARQQPDKVKMVMDKIKAEGLMPTIETVFNKLEQPLPLGYCNVGRVIALGDGVSEFVLGDRVASNGQHAELVNIPKNLVAKIPDNITDEEAAFAVIGSIGLQGIRLCGPTFGETIVVTGLGLIGLLTAQMLLANGCKVIGIDIDTDKCALAEKWGVITVNPAAGADPVKVVMEATEGIGADGVIITASAKDNVIISQAAQMSRKRGRIILVGVIGLNLNRAEFYEKELTFQVSCSYGPGRYDENYEQKGIDFPLPFVRWPEKRNFEAILQAISSSQIKVKELVTEVIDLEDYQKIYSNIGQSKSIASILKYPDTNTGKNNGLHSIRITNSSFENSKGVVGIIGAGNFTKMTMLPALKDSGAHFSCIVSKGGVTGTALARKHGFAHSTTDYQEIFNDKEIDLVMITTRHDLHAALAVKALKAGKHVFIEKPLALNEAQLQSILDAQKLSGKTITVGFNRRFSPHALKLKSILGSGQINVIATMNAGFIPYNVWVHDLSVGGGRIVGEACHFIDLITYLTGSHVKSVCMNAMGLNPQDNTDNATLLLKYENGSTGVINYFANGSKAYSKERVEVYSQERTLVLDNFRITRGFGFKGFRKLKTKLDKGHKNQFHSLIQKIQTGGEPLIPLEELINTTRASFAAINSLKKKRWIEL